MPDYTSEGSPHDQAFNEAAKALSLDVSQDSDGREQSVTRVPATLEGRYAFTLQRLANALAAGDAPTFRLAMAFCQCIPARCIVVAAPTINAGDIHCRACGKKFTFLRMSEGSP